MSLLDLVENKQNKIIEQIENKRKEIEELLLITIKERG